jgi:hypothetical protein
VVDETSLLLLAPIAMIQVNRRPIKYIKPLASLLIIEPNTKKQTKMNGAKR